MKQEIVIKVDVRSDKGRSDVLKIAAAVDGVFSVALLGVNKDQVVVKGDGVDEADLTRRLRKKFGYAKIVSQEHGYSGKPSVGHGYAKKTTQKVSGPSPSGAAISLGHGYAETKTHEVSEPLLSGVAISVGHGYSGEVSVGHGYSGDVHAETKPHELFGLALSVGAEDKDEVSVPKLSAGNEDEISVPILYAGDALEGEDPLSYDDELSVPTGDELEDKDRTPCKCGSSYDCRSKQREFYEVVYDPETSKDCSIM